MSESKSMPDFNKVTLEQWKKMGITKEQFLARREKARLSEEAAPKVGERAPDFDLKRMSPEGRLTERRIRLSDLRGRPVALVFGSYT